MSYLAALAIDTATWTAILFSGSSRVRMRVARIDTFSSSRIELAEFFRQYLLKERTLKSVKRWGGTT